LIVFAQSQLNDSYEPVAPTHLQAFLITILSFTFEKYVASWLPMPAFVLQSATLRLHQVPQSEA